MSTFEVVVGNIGTVHTGADQTAASTMYDSYVELSKTGYGRTAGESVYLMQDGEPIQEHQGTAGDESEQEDNA